MMVSTHSPRLNLLIHKPNWWVMGIHTFHFFCFFQVFAGGILFWKSPRVFFIIHHLDWMGKVQGFLCTIMFQCLWLRTKLINWVELILPIANYNCSNDTFRNRGNNLQLSQCTGSLCIRLQLRLITCFKMFFNPLRLMPFGSSVYSHPPKIQLFSFSP